VFDAGRPLIFRIEPGGASFLESSDSDGGIRLTRTAGEGWEWAEFDLGPQLIRTRARLTLSFMSSGQAKVRVDSPLIDVPVWDVSRRPTRTDTATAWVMTSVFGVVAVGLGFVLVAVLSDPDSELAPVALFAPIAAFVGTGVLLARDLRTRMQWRRDDRL
jgi:hypothetical protein